MENNNDNDTHDFYFLVRNYVENKKKEDELFSLLDTELSQEQCVVILTVISDLLRFLKTDVDRLKYFVATEDILIVNDDIQYFITCLKNRLPCEDSTTFIMPDYKLTLTIEKIKRAIVVLSKVVTLK